MSYEHLKLENQLCFALYASSKALIKIYKPLLDQLDITYTQYITLLVLWDKDEQTVKELGEKLCLDSGTMTPLLKRLEVMGLIKRQRGLKDERNVYVVLTQKGIEMKDKALEIPVKAFCSTGLSIDEASELKEKLSLLLKKLQ